MQDNEIIVKNWIDKSDEALIAAEKNLEIELLSTSQNRLYYAIFYIVSALAKKNNFVTAKHNQLLGWFNKEFVKSQKIDVENSRIYTKSFEFRQKNDYTFEFKPNKEKLKKDLELAKEFILKIKQLLEI